MGLFDTNVSKKLLTALEEQAQLLGPTISLIAIVMSAGQATVTYGSANAELPFMASQIQKARAWLEVQVEVIAQRHLLPGVNPTPALENQSNEDVELREQERREIQMIRSHWINTVPGSYRTTRGQLIRISDSSDKETNQDQPLRPGKITTSLTHQELQSLEEGVSDNLVDDTNQLIESPSVTPRQRQRASLPFLIEDAASLQDRLAEEELEPVGRIREPKQLPPILIPNQVTLDLPRVDVRVTDTRAIQTPLIFASWGSRFLQFGKSTFHSPTVNWHLPQSDLFGASPIESIPVDQRLLNQLTLDSFVFTVESALIEKGADAEQAASQATALLFSLTQGFDRPVQAYLIGSLYEGYYLTHLDPDIYSKSLIQDPLGNWSIPNSRSTWEILVSNEGIQLEVHYASSFCKLSPDQNQEVLELRISRSRWLPNSILAKGDPEAWNEEIVTITPTDSSK